MCGIFGAQLDTSLKGETIRNALESMRHRGPDGLGIWQNPEQNQALGHTRLAVVGLKSGEQPISNENHTIHCVVNGEFYEHRNIASSLKGQGHHFRGDSDSEILVHLYETYGVDCLNHLRGEFAFILIDQKSQTLFAARDPFGIKPLLYHTSSSGLMLASEAKALFAAGVPARWDGPSVSVALQLQYTLPHRTLFENIYQVPPGHYLLARGGKVTLHCYWDMDYPRQDEAVDMVPEQAFTSFAEAFEDAVYQRLQADVDVCFHLSGGLDSTSVLAVARKHYSKPLHCFSVGFTSEQKEQRETYDEGLLARETARFYNARHHLIELAPQDLIDHMSDAVYYSEGLAVNGHLSAKYLLNRAISKAGFKVALTGEGADEVLAGYPHLRLDLMRYQGVENPSELVAGNRASKGIMLASGEGLCLRHVNDTLGFTPAFLEAKASYGFKIREHLHPQYLGNQQTPDAYEQLLQMPGFLSQLKGRHPVHQSLYLWSKTALCQYILNTLGDGLEMSASIEGRLPFLDRNLFATIRRLPLKYKIHNGIEKYILREVLKKDLPETLYKRRKHPFVAPPLSHSPKAREAMQDLLRSAIREGLPFFHGPKLLATLDKLEKASPTTRSVFDPILMTALSFGFLSKMFKLEVSHDRI